VREAEAAINRLTAAPIDDLIVRDMTVLRLRALVAQADGDETAYPDFRDRYRAMATEFGFEGQMALAGAMP
jgi:adenylate cyclase